MSIFVYQDYENFCIRKIPVTDGKSICLYIHSEPHSTLIQEEIPRLKNMGLPLSIKKYSYFYNKIKKYRKTHNYNNININYFFNQFILISL